MKKIIFSIPFIIATLLIVSFCLKSRTNKPLQTPMIDPTMWYSEEFLGLNKLELAAQTLAIENNMVLLKNKTMVLPLNNLNRQISTIQLGGSAQTFQETIGLFAAMKTAHYAQLSDCPDTCLNRIKSAEICVISLHASGEKGNENSINSENLTILDKLPATLTKILILFGDKNIFNSIDTTKADAIIWAKENHYLAQKSFAQLLFGAIESKGILSNNIGSYKQGEGISTQTNGRLKFGLPEDYGIDTRRLNEIDAIALDGIKKGAYPGCQIVVAVKGAIIYRKSFGEQTKNGAKVKNTDLYDIASITKIAASTLLTMHLVDKGLLDINKTLGDYIPETTGNGPYSKINIREMLAHQAGLTPFIRFYSNTLKNGSLLPTIFTSEKKVGFDLKVADGIFMRNDFVDSMYAQIINTPLGIKKYVYSDLCFYFIQKINEKIVQKKQNDYLLANIYLPMGLRYLRYKPLDYFPKIQITPTENDKTFRKQLIHGYVHDPGAAMLGGVAGHAGLFSNATDLASIMQLFLQKGKYAGANYFSEKIIDDFTRAQFSGNKRGAGFDRPNASGGGTCDELASARSFGHSGFTGALAWADPKDEIIFIFLSNRVNPDAENWKLRDMGIRTKIQHVVYQAVNTRKK